MEWLIATYELAALVAIVVLGLVLLAYRLIHAIRVYFRFQGTWLVTCPETHQAAMVEVAAISMGMEAILDEPSLRLSKCSRWPMRGGGCAQGCLWQIEAHPPELMISTASKTL
jgi:hypothetical protein